ncbi:hypothetical protein Dda_6221 [Drechslerella dactyloides]|uniref:Uncharacterized protein n=1 Tax=Drechslerella dactyloides TaxID=74499 RepID=A0AAD6IZE0_DREDA|nr:hypothetical protein Dda_6221 [Drechslerella dactyloides]
MPGTMEARRGRLVLSALISLSLLACAAAAAESTTSDLTMQPTTLNLTTIAPMPSTWAPEATCYTPAPAVGKYEVIYNVGCGLQSRRECCPPGYNDSDVIFGMGTRGCPNGYTGDSQWDGPEGIEPIKLEASGTRTVVCCPSGVSLWSMIGDNRDPGNPLCYAHMPFSTTRGSVTQSQITTFARPFFFAQAVGTPTHDNPPGTTSRGSSEATGTTAGTSTGEISSQRRNGLGTVAIVFIVIGVLVFLLLVGVLAYYCLIRKKKRQAPDSNEKFDVKGENKLLAALGYKMCRSEMRLKPTQNSSKSKSDGWKNGVEMTTMEGGGAVIGVAETQVTKRPTFCENMEKMEPNVNEEIIMSKV